MAKMNHEEFLNKMQEKFDLCMKEARVKNADYASHGKEGASGLNNFYETAAESGVTPLQAWHTHYYKHYLAIRQAVRGQELRSETLAGRFKDAAVYAIIGWLLAEEMEAERAAAAVAIDETNQTVYDGEPEGGEPEEVKSSRFRAYCHALDIWVIKDIERYKWLICPDRVYATNCAKSFNKYALRYADGLNWITVTELNDYIKAAKVNAANKRFSDNTKNNDSSVNDYYNQLAIGNRLRPLQNVQKKGLQYTEPRFHTAKDVQVDTKSPDGTSERWYIIDTVENRRLHITGMDSDSNSMKAADTAQVFNNNPETTKLYQTWEPFPAI